MELAFFQRPQVETFETWHINTNFEREPHHKHYQYIEPYKKKCPSQEVPIMHQYIIYVGSISSN